MGSHTLPVKMSTTTTTTTTITVLVLAFTLSHSHPFFLRTDEEAASLSSRSSNQTEDDSGLTQDTIVGVFDTVTGLTYGLGGLFQQFEDGFEKIRPQSDTSVTNKVFLNDEEDATLGSSAVVGLFDSLRNLNRQVGKLVGRVGDTLNDRRDNVVRLASNLDTGLKNVGSGFHDWREENFGVTLRRKKDTE